MNHELDVSSESPDGFEAEELSTADQLNQTMDDERMKIRDAVTAISRIATLTVVDIYELEEMGVELSPEVREQVDGERLRLNQSTGNISRLWKEMNETLVEVQRGVGSIQYLIDPENN